MAETGAGPGEEDTVPEEDAVPDCGQALLDWGRQHKARVHPALDLFATGRHGERGGVARAAIAAGEELFYIPVELTIQGPLEAQQEGELESFYKELQRPLSNVVRLALTL